MRADTWPEGFGSVSDAADEAVTWPMIRVGTSIQSSRQSSLAL
jgi:hypothetical protein